MKKTAILMVAMALGMAASAQMTYRVVYVPGPGERQAGISLMPAFVPQHLNVEGTWTDAVSGNPVSQVAGQRLSNLVSFGVGAFYGYETVGHDFGWGNYTSLFYSVTPFSGTVTLSPNGTPEEHRLSFIAQHVRLQVNPFLSYRISDRFSVSAGLGLNLAPRIPSKVKMDGQALEKSDSGNEESLVLSILGGLALDVNAGVKYWFSDDMFVGLRMQYTVLNVVDLLSRDSDEDADELLREVNGAVSLDLDNQTARTTLLQRNSFQAVFSLGFVW